MFQLIIVVVIYLLVGVVDLVFCFDICSCGGFVVVNCCCDIGQGVLCMIKFGQDVCLFVYQCCWVFYFCWGFGQGRIIQYEFVGIEFFEGIKFVLIGEQVNIFDNCFDCGFVFRCCVGELGCVQCSGYGEGFYEVFYFFVFCG